MSHKLVYFIRHGESLLNAQGIRQGADGALSEKGKTQAHLTAERLADRTFDTMLVSPYERTTETAGIINDARRKPLKIEYTPLLQERRNPKDIIGKSIYDLEVIKVVDAIDKSYHSDDFRYSDEENFLDLKHRAASLLEYLSQRKEKSILCVTHGMFLRMVVAYIVFGPELTASHYNSLSFHNESNNAGITVCEYTKGWFGPPPDKRWKLIAWDDYVRNPSIKSRGI